MREQSPADYIRVIASLVPKEAGAGHRMSDLNDDELEAGIAALQRVLAPRLDG